ncbi:DUF6542 domain-containing protein [Kutzneria kofuensis]|uniref:DUF6542 domain-containing protein n=1 Tax=Kutzneria kofuensis TaxID=103725 RepID=A0A7W9KEP1_9PSEU|nr:DUF6542 domain-containing protein [Kutzneria kofuensis]MBB5891242.1 hypothetical protein [Kutzneria kofuensis]
MDDETTTARRPWGLPWWAAILLPLVTTAAGAYADLTFNHSLGVPFQAAYAGGCVLSVLLVRRRNLFGPMVQPPLILLFAAPPVALALSGHSLGSGLVSQALTIGTPLVDNFMVQAGVTIATIVLGLIRMILTRRRPAAPEPESSEPDAEPAAA